MIDHSKTKVTPKIRWLLCTLLFLAFFVPATLQAEAGDTWIVFHSNRPNPNANEPTHWDIWKLDPEGDGGSSDDSLFGVALTNEPSMEWDPTYSVEDRGGTVVFVSDKNGWPKLYRMSIDGGSWMPLTYGEWSDADPCYSFDGSKIAFTSNRDGNWDIYVMNSDRSDLRRITHSSAYDRSPCFSTNGDKVYFISNRDTDNSSVWGDYEIYVVDVEGGTPVKAIVDGNNDPIFLQSTEHDPCCSPTDPDIIVFGTNNPTLTYIAQTDKRINYELYSYRFSTRDTVRLTESWAEYECEDADGNPTTCYDMWGNSAPCFHPRGDSICWTSANWTNVGWRSNHPGGPYEPPYWRHDAGQGASHQVWLRRTTDSKGEEDFVYWFPCTYWGWSGSGPGHGHWNGGHQHHKHFSPSWDYQP